MDLGRLKQSDVVAAAAGLLLLASLFLPWFGVSGSEDLCGADADSCSAFEAFSVLDILLVAVALVPWIPVLAVARSRGLPWSPGEVTVIAGMIAVTLIFYSGVIDRVGESRSLVSLDFGWYVALLASIGIIVGAGMSQIRWSGR